MKRVAEMIATWFGTGHLRPGPGTWGSVVAVALGLSIDYLFGFWTLVGMTVAVTALGFWAVAVATQGETDPDRSEIVIDEVAGQWIALLFPAAAFWWMGLADWALRAWPGWVAAFLFFRLFDIWKPGPIGAADRRGDAPGVMIDDLIAGVFAGIATIAAAALAHGVMMQ
jgi:phosphatidylglycerophosphatase A